MAATHADDLALRCVPTRPFIPSSTSCRPPTSPSVHLPSPSPSLPPPPHTHPGKTQATRTAFHLLTSRLPGSQSALGVAVELCDSCTKAPDAGRVLGRADAVLATVELDPAARATIDGNRLDYEVVVATLSHRVSSLLEAVGRIVESAQDVADGRLPDAAYGLRWLGGYEHDVLGKQSSRPNKKKGLEPTADIGLSDLMRGLSHTENAEADLSCRGGAMGQRLDVRSFRPGGAQEVPSAARARAPLYARVRAAMSLKMGKPLNLSRITDGSFAGDTLVVPFWRKTNSPSPESKWFPQLQSAAELLASYHVAMEEVVIGVLRHVPMVARLQHVQLAMEYAEACQHLDALKQADDLLKGGEPVTSAALLASYVQTAPSYGGAANGPFHKTSAGFQLHAAHEDANACALCTMHVTLTERRDGTGTVFSTSVGSKVLEVPSITHTCTAFLATGTHMTKATSDPVHVGRRQRRSGEQRRLVDSLREKYPGEMRSSYPFAIDSERLYSSSYVRLTTERLAEIAWALRQTNQGVPKAGVLRAWTSEDDELRLLDADAE